MWFFTDQPAKLAKIFPVTNKLILESVTNLTGRNPDSEDNQIFATLDVLQARVLPNPQYFTDQNISGVKIFTLNSIGAQSVADYDARIFEVVRDVFSEFLAKVTEDDFKRGNYPLKDAFLMAKELDYLNL